MVPLIRVPIAPLLPQRFSEVLDADRYSEFEEVIERARAAFDGRVIWNVNSTSKGGGVAEMLRSLIAYGRGGGVDVRWIVIEGNPDFFEVTKRIHNNLHGFAGDGGDLGPDQKAVYEDNLQGHFEESGWLVRKGDVVILHDPQTAGLTKPMTEAGAHVIWRCHVGLDLPNDLSRQAWNFLIPYVEQAHAYVFSRKAHAWEGMQEEKLNIIAPSIDAFSPKNQDLDGPTVDAILSASGLVNVNSTVPSTFTREDGTPGRVDRKVTFADGGPPPPGDVPLVVQVSRWDRLKDPIGVIQGFADHVAPGSDAHFVYAGPSAESVYDDPEGLDVLEESVAHWKKLPDGIRERVHLAGLPMEDVEENAAIVNAIQRKAAVVVQKSIAEGFGLTVAEAMWKARPVVASRIGGIQDQIVHGETGILIDDPTDLKAYGTAVADLLRSNGSSAAEKLGRDAQNRVRDEYLGQRHLMQWFQVASKLMSEAQRS